MCNFSIFSGPHLINRDYYIPTFICLVFLICTEWVNRHTQHGLDIALIRSHIVKFAIYLGILLLMFWLGGKAETFIYFQF